MKRMMWMAAVAAWLVIPAYADAPKKADETTKKADEAAKKDKPIPAKKLIEVRIDQFVVPARALNIPLPGRIQTMRDLLDQFDKWSKDDEVGALLLNMDGLSLGLPDIEELSAGLAQVRKAGKKVVSFLNSGDDMGYLLACQSDEIAIAPTGSLGIQGMGRVFPFMRGMYQMQGVEYDVITAGRYKYPGFMNKREPDQYFKEEFNTILDSWFGDYVRIIADGRKLSTERVKKAIDVALFSAQDAKQYGLVDVIAYYDEYVDRVVRRDKFAKGSAGGSSLENVTSLQDLLTAVSKEMKDAQEGYKAVGPKIAILHARGPIVDVNLGSGVFSSQMIMRDEFVKTVEEIRKNKTIRAVVLHIDSPGGSGYASDVIWRHLKALDEEKPLVVSMGTVAGSGGYYIACPARLIFAEPTTITGSIGVLAILANQASAINRMDVKLEEMKRGERSLMGMGHRDMPADDRAFLQKYLLDFYEVFLDRVAASRKMPKDEVRKIAEGRIYTGRQALKLGLVDRLGGLKDAIAAVRDMANIPPSAEIKLVHYPRPSSLGELAQGLLGFSTMMQTLTEAQRPAMPVPFDTQLRFFARRVQPLCWMALPDMQAVLHPAGVETSGLDLPRPLDPMTQMHP